MFIKKIVMFVIIITLFNSCGINYEKKIEEGFKMPKKYDSSMSSDKCEVFEGKDQMEDFERMNKFVKDIQNKKKSFIRIFSTTVEGDLYIEQVYYDGEYIHLICDPSRDRFAGNTEISRYKYLNIEVNEEKVPEREDKIYVNFYLVDRVEEDNEIYEVGEVEKRLVFLFEKNK